jgi:hypothetical protein
MRAYLEEMLRGPGHLRFVIQPLIAILFGLRDGRMDRALGRPPYVVSLLTRSPAGRRARLREGLRSIVVPLCLALGASLLFQFLVMRRVHLWAALAYAALFVALPYAITRGVTNRALGTRRAAPPSASPSR